MFAAFGRVPSFGFIFYQNIELKVNLDVICPGSTDVVPGGLRKHSDGSGSFQNNYHTAGLIFPKHANFKYIHS